MGRVGLVSRDTSFFFVFYSRIMVIEHMQYGFCLTVTQYVVFDILAPYGRGT